MAAQIRGMRSLLALHHPRSQAELDALPELETTEEERTAWNALHNRPHASVWIHPAARVWHSRQEMKDQIALLAAPEVQATLPGGKSELSVWDTGDYWLFYDQDKKLGLENERVLLGAADPLYSKVLSTAISEDSCTVGTSDYVPPHTFEPADNAQEIRDALPRDASLKEAVDALLRTCKGCAELYFPGQS